MRKEIERRPKTARGNRQQTKIGASDKRTKRPAANQGGHPPVSSDENGQSRN